MSLADVPTPLGHGMADLGQFETGADFGAAQAAKQAATHSAHRATSTPSLAGGSGSVANTGSELGKASSTLASPHPKVILRSANLPSGALGTTAPGVSFGPAPSGNISPSWITGQGLTGNYFVNPDFTGLIMTETDSTVDFNWGLTGPDPVVGNNQFSVRWTGQVQAKTSETYTFLTTVGGGVRLQVNGQQLISDWTDHLTPTTDSGTISLVAGQLYDVTLEYFDGQGPDAVQLRWSAPSVPEQVIPSLQLYPNAFRFSDPVYTVNEDGTAATITVVRNGYLTGSASVSYSTQNAFAVGSSGSDGDFVPQTGTLTFAPNQSSNTFTVPITQDGRWDGEEYLVVTLASPSAGFNLDWEHSWATLLIDDIISPPPYDFDGTNYAPVALDDYFYANFGGSVSTYQLAPGDSVLANDFDYFDAALTITGYSTPYHGVLSFDTNTGRFMYSPNSTFAGTDRFTYVLSNGTVSRSGTVYLAQSAALDPASNLLARDAAPAAPPAADSWSVTRRADLQWAKITSAAPATDTFEMLAKKVGLEASQVANWLSWEDPSKPPVLTDAQNKAIRDALADSKQTVKAVFGNQTAFWIPNMVLSYWGGEVKQLGRNWVRWEADMQALVDKGYNVQYAGYAPNAAVVVTYNNPDLATNNPQEFHRRYERLRAEAYYKAAKALGTTEDPWAADKFLKYMADNTQNKSLYGTYFWGHGWQDTKVKNVVVPGGMLLNASVKTVDDFTTYAMPYQTWTGKLNYKLGAGFIFACFSAAAKSTDNPAASVFSSNSIFWGSNKILVFPLAAPPAQKLLRRYLPDIEVGVGKNTLTFNPPSIEKVLADNKGVK